MATAVLETNEPVAEESDRKTRVKLHPENVYVYPANADLSEVQGNKIEREDGTQVDMYRAYTISKTNAEGKSEICAYAFGKNDNEALGRFVESKGYTAEVTFDRPRGAPRGPRIDGNVANAMKKLWDKNPAGRSICLEFCMENKQYVSCFEFNEVELKQIAEFKGEE